MSIENDMLGCKSLPLDLGNPPMVCDIRGATTTTKNKRIRANKRVHKERVKKMKAKSRTKDSSSSASSFSKLSAKKLKEQKLISVLEDFLLSRNSASVGSSVAKSPFLDNVDWIIESDGPAVLSEDRNERPDTISDTIEDVIKLKKRKRCTFRSARPKSKIKPKAKRNKTERKQKKDPHEIGEASKEMLDTKIHNILPRVKLVRVAVSSTKAKRRTSNLNGRIKGRKQNVAKRRKMGDQEAVVEEPETTQINSHDMATPSTSNASKREAEPKCDKVCQVCEKGGTSLDLIRCEGGCIGLFHSTCVSYEPGTNFQCQECSSGQHSCFVCKRNDGGVRHCSIGQCGKFYHLECVQSYKSARIDTATGKLICPLHTCLACALLVNCKMRSRGKLYRCNRCPVAYHANDACLAAGSAILSSSVIVCPVHYRPKDRLKSYQINVNWCFVCSQGGSLMCCETCPASFHAECLNIEPPEGSYYCVDCLAKTQPKYGDIVWVKLGNYRWWPAEVCNPKNVPTNIQVIPHLLGEFPVHFFGTYDYYWTRRSRTFQFLEGDHRTHASNTNRLAQTFKTALEEALVAFQKWKSVKDTRDAQNHEKNNLKPPPYKSIKANKPVGRVAAMSAVDNSQASVCNCDPKSENPCGSDGACLNRLLMYECDPDTCPAGKRCQNQQFKMLQYVEAEIFRTEGKGWGLKCLDDIKKGQFVNEYVGEIIDEEECRTRMKKMQEENATYYYFLTIDKDRIIDAGRKGNLSRFMNHSCQPNCELHKWTVRGDTRVGLFAVCDIPSGTELTFNYNLECLGNGKATCRCNAANCSGFIGERPKTVMAPPQGPKKGTLKHRRKRSKVVKAHHEDECFRCGLDGQLLLCDRKNCTKGYHLECVNMEKLPPGKWECPWHHCDECGKLSSILCSACPTSYCDDHNAEANITSMSDGTLLCAVHMAEQIATLNYFADGTVDTNVATTNEQSDESVQISDASWLQHERNGTASASEQPTTSNRLDVANIKQETTSRDLNVEIVTNGSYPFERNGCIKLTTAKNSFNGKDDDLTVVVQRRRVSVKRSVTGRRKTHQNHSRVMKQKTTLRVKIERHDGVLPVKKRAKERTATKTGRVPEETNSPSIVSDPSVPLPTSVISPGILV